MTSRCQATCLLRRASDDGLQALVGDEIEQLERRPGGMGFALLPLAHRRGRRVQMKSEHRLAELQRFAQAFDVGSTEFPHRRRADSVDRKSVVSGTSVSVRVDLGGRSSYKKKNK